MTSASPRSLSPLDIALWMGALALPAGMVASIVPSWRCFSTKRSSCGCRRRRRNVCSVNFVNRITLRRRPACAGGWAHQTSGMDAKRSWRDVVSEAAVFIIVAPFAFWPALLPGIVLGLLVATSFGSFVAVAVVTTVIWVPFAYVLSSLLEEDAPRRAQRDEPEHPQHVPSGDSSEDGDGGILGWCYSLFAS